MKGDSLFYSLSLVSIAFVCVFWQLLDWIFPLKGRVVGKMALNHNLKNGSES